MSLKLQKKKFEIKDKGSNPIFKISKKLKKRENISPGKNSLTNLTF